jgi:hypothetical protein
MDRGGVAAMTTWLIVGALLLLAVGLVSSQLFRLKDWLDRQPAIPNPETDPQSPDHPDHSEPR